jgi:hypothetical protein
MIYLIIVGATNTSTNPINEYINELVAAFIFLSSPNESIYLNPDRIKEITATTADIVIA